MQRGKAVSPSEFSSTTEVSAFQRRLADERWKTKSHLGFFKAWLPIDNPFVESINGKFKDKYHTMNWFLCLDNAREKIEEYRIDKNTIRPYAAIVDLPSKVFIYLHQNNPEFLR